MAGDWTYTINFLGRQMFKWLKFLSAKKKKWLHDGKGNCSIQVTGQPTAWLYRVISLKHLDQHRILERNAKRSGIASNFIWFWEMARWDLDRSVFGSWVLVYKHSIIYIPITSSSFPFFAWSKYLLIIVFNELFAPATSTLNAIATCVAQVICEMSK